jgi:hypothetical protein
MLPGGGRVPSSHVTETVCRQQLRPVLQEGAEVPDRLFQPAARVYAVASGHQKIITSRHEPR